MEILFRTVCDRLARSVRVAVVALAVVMLVALSLQVVMRYAFGRPLTWTEELAVACFGWAMLLAIAVGVRDGIHVRMDLLVDLLPGRCRPLLERLVALAIAGAGSFLAWSGWNYTTDSGGLTSAAMAYPMAWLYGSAPVCGALIAVFGLERALFGAPARARPARIEMTLTAWILTGGFAGLVVLGVPFAFAILLCVIAVLITTGIEPMLLPQTLVDGTQSFSLLAVPFFMLAGELMSAGGLSQRLLRVAEVFVRHLPGGMELTVILAALIFAAVSGSAPATTAAIGAVMIPAMVERGYDKAYATALVVSAGVLAPLIPPSIAFVIWGVIAEQSISRLFLSGVLPGVMMALGMAMIVLAKASRSGRPRQPRARWPEVKAALRDGIWALLAPVVVLGGIYGGMFTPTESAVVVSVYALVIGLFVERRLSFAELPQRITAAMAISAVVMAIVAVSNGFAFLVAQEQLATRLASWLALHFHERWTMLLALNVTFFLLAAVMDEVAIMVILGPMLISIANQFGVDPIHFGAIIVTNVAIGMAAPPVGYCLFVGMAISGMKLMPVARAVMPFVLMMLVTLVLVTYIPAFALALAR